MHACAPWVVRELSPAKKIACSESPAKYSGTWSFALAASQPLVTGEISVRGNQITFADEMLAEGQNVPICAEGHTNTWSYADETLTFEPNGADRWDQRAGDMGASLFPVE
jgi:hypothetical protein